MRGLRCRIEKQIFSWKNGRDPGGFFTRFLYAPDGDRIWSVELWIPAMAQMYLCIFVSCEIW